MSESAPGTSLVVPDAVAAQAVAAQAAPPPLPQPHCQNCDAELVGPYCAACGQRHDPHLHSLSHFIAEAAENITHADSRLWRTLWALVAKPGFLTREFLVGKRARYLPPFRLYLVVTLLFFVLVAALPGGESKPMVSVEPGQQPATVAGAGAAKQTSSESCTTVGYSGPGEQWIQPALTRACRSAALDGGRAIQQAFLHNIPRALFLFLPLLAAAMMLLYWRPRRYYVEHLLFFIHNHAGLFVAFGLYSATTAIAPLAPVEDWLGVALFAYLVWYLYVAMRKVYGQSRRRTLAKFVTIAAVYAVFGGITLLLTALYSAVML